MPVSASPLHIHAPLPTFTSRKLGLFVSLCVCSLLTHAVTAVGYTWTGDLATSYWLVKNSCELLCVIVCLSMHASGLCFAFHHAGSASKSPNFRVSTLRPVPYYAKSLFLLLQGALAGERAATSASE